MQVQTDFRRDVYCVMGLPFDAVSMDQAVARVRTAGLDDRRCFISTPNLNFVMAARADAAFRDSVLHSHLSLADGMPLVWMARLLGLPIRERVPGAGLFEQLQAHDKPSLGVYFFGGPPGAAQAACERLNREGRGLHGCGFDEPGFGSVEAMSTPAQLDRINASGAQFLVVALGAQKGQAWIEHNAPRLRPPLLCHLGAVVNFVAGSVRRAPSWAQRLGLEWLWRIKEEPGLWRRYWRDGTQFLHLLCTQLLPCALMLRLHRPTPGQLQQAALFVERSAGTTTLSLKGAWAHANLQPLREALAQAERNGDALTVVMAGVSHVDSAFVGLLLLAYGRFSGSPAAFHMQGANPRVARLVRFHGAAFLLAPSSSRSG